MNEEKDTEISFAMVGDTTVVRARFADGVREIPEYVIAELGGPSEFEKLADSLAQTTYPDFMQGFHQVLADRKVASILDDYKARHFSPMFRH